LGFRVHNLGYRDEGLGFRVEGLGFCVLGLGFRFFGLRSSQAITLSVVFAPQITSPTKMPNSRVAPAWRLKI
jgi:hypothetical protein